MNPLTVLEGCAYTVLQTLPTASVDCIITSPPYWGLRDYGIPPTDWPACSYIPMPGLEPIAVPAETSCLGLEPTLNAFLAHLVLIFTECRRVLKPTGSAWVNMGDAYATGTTAARQATTITGSDVPGGWAERSQSERAGNPTGCKTKDLMGQPWRVAFALQAAGWYLRQDNIWHKPNPMPESIRDRATKAHEYVFHMTKSERYYFDAAAWSEKTSGTAHARRSYKTPDGWDTTSGKGGHGSFHRDGREDGQTDYQPKRKPGVPPKSAPDHNGMIRANGSFQAAVVDLVATRNKRSVWTVPTFAYSEAHYATYPPALITPPLLASTSAKGVCPTCGAPWTRQIERVDKGYDGSKYGENAVKATGGCITGGTAKSTLGSSNGLLVGQTLTLGWQPTCECPSPQVSPSVVLDPFGGSGTTAEVALNHGRHAILIERGPQNIALIHKRLAPVLKSPVLNLA